MPRAGWRLGEPSPQSEEPETVPETVPETETAMRSEAEVRAKLATFEGRSEDYALDPTGRAILAIRIETLRWVLEGDRP